MRFHRLYGWPPQIAIRAVSGAEKGTRGGLCLPCRDSQKETTARAMLAVFRASTPLSNSCKRFCGPDWLSPCGPQ